MGLSPPPLLSQGLSCCYPSSPLHKSQAFIEKRRQSVQAEPPGSPFYSWGHHRANLSTWSAHLGSEGSFRHALGPAERKEKRFISQWGWLLLGGSAKSTRYPPPPPSSHQRLGGDFFTNLPSCTLKRRDPRLLLAGWRLPQSRESLTGQERQLNAVKIALSAC